MSAESFVARLRACRRISRQIAHPIQRCRTTTDQLKGYRIDDPQRTPELALRRSNIGNGREDAADALVDFVIALEALLLPYDEQTRRSEMTYRCEVPERE